ncbi:unnamed protein product [Mytilus coruscus]|uniref:Uncharacterized protein n=1 Tax=Mytilus coruscus TaxID=42192 RepID=A0A6J8D385_MYTCO|nr:unnamed protein product [Mytilus coruscus]
MERRNILWPVFKREQRMGKNVKFKEEKLYVNGQRIYPEDVQQMRTQGHQYNRGTYNGRREQSKHASFDGPPFQHIRKTEMLKTVPHRTGQQGDNVDELTNRIDEFDVNSISFQTDLDTFVEALNKLYRDSAIDTFGTRTVYSNTQRKADQPWFDDQCHEKRNAFHKAKKKYNGRKLQSAAKSYKFQMNKCYQEYQFKLENDLRATSESEPRALWKIRNKLNRSADRQSKISIDELYDYFKNLNIAAEDVESDNDFDIPDCNDDLINEILNGNVTEDHASVNSRKILESVRSRCISESTPIPSTYDEEITKLRDAPWDAQTLETAQKLPTFESKRSALYRTRQKTVPRHTKY